MKNHKISEEKVINLFISGKSINWMVNNIYGSYDRIFINKILSNYLGENIVKKLKKWHRLILSESRKGENNPAKRLSSRIKIRLSKLGKKRPYLSDRYKGEGNPHYKNGIITGKRVLLETKKVCEKCRGNKNLNVHHKDGNRKNNNLSNLLLLCKSCHSKEHRGKEWHNMIVISRKRGRKFPVELYPNYGMRNKNHSITTKLQISSTKLRAGGEII